MVTHVQTQPMTGTWHDQWLLVCSSACGRALCLSHPIYSQGTYGMGCR